VNCTVSDEEVDAAVDEAVRMILTSATSYNPSFIGANGGTTASAEAALLANAAADTSYFNIHTMVFPGGEIRGFLIPAAVPEPSSVIMLGMSVLAVAAYGLRRRMVK
jgi:hypothetical protein